MSRKLRVAAAVAAALVLGSSALAAPRVGGRAYLVVSASGDVLLQRAADERVPIASITKLMTVLVTREHTKLDDVVTIRPQAAETGESSAELRVGEKLTVRELIEAALIQSANDAAVALAQHVGHGSVTAFVALMNAKARQLGLTRTHFENPDGLDATGHYSSARDVTKLAQTVMHDSFVRSVVRRRVARITGRTLHTWNDLLGRFPGLIGVKTGHTSDAGWSEVAAAQGNGVTIYATLLGEPGRSRAQRRPRTAPRMGVGAIPGRADRLDQPCLRDCAAALGQEAARARRGERGRARRPAGARDDGARRDARRRRRSPSARASSSGA